MVTNVSSALPILRELGSQSGGSMIRGGDFSMLKVWAGLEARSFLQASVETVSDEVCYDNFTALTCSLGRTMREIRPALS